MINIKEGDRHYEISFPYSPQLVASIKTMIPGRRFDPVQKVWTVPNSSKEQLMQWLRDYTKTKPSGAPSVQIENFDIPELPDLNVEINLKMQLYEYQRKGVAYTLQHKKVIIGDEPGLGKTCQAIASVIADDMFPSLVICPASLKKNWQREWNSWSDKRAVVMSDKIVKNWDKYLKVGMVDVFIVNYESLKKYFVESINTPPGMKLRANHITTRPDVDLFKSIIIDESHRCKDGQTQQSKFVMKIAKGKEMVLALTGTPVVNKPFDLIPQLHILEQLDNFGGYKAFVSRYCDNNNHKELNYKLNKFCFYRRLKKEVLTQLPDKMRTIDRSDISNRAEYDKAESDLRKYLRENLMKTEGEINRSMRGEVMVQMMILRKIAARGKFEQVQEYINEVIEAGEKVVVFAHHIDVLQHLKTEYPRAVSITGADNMDDRQRAIDGFQNDPAVQVILCSIKAAGVGITLTASSRVAFVELPWTAADTDQCEDRCHRIGQKDSVQVTYFLGYNTIDEYVYEIIEKKRGIAQEITGDDNEIETNMIDNFISLFNLKDDK